jgi:hypothetical protein
MLTDKPYRVWRPATCEAMTMYETPDRNAVEHDRWDYVRLVDALAREAELMARIEELERSIT